MERVNSQPNACENVFVEQFFECQPDLVRRLSGKIRDAGAREDLLHDIFIRFYLKFGTLSPHDNLCGYLYRITENVIADYYRRETRFVKTDDVSVFENRRRRKSLMSNTN